MDSRDELIRLIYEGIDNDATWSGFLERFAREMNAIQGVFWVAYPGHPSWSATSTFGVDPQDLAEYQEKWAAQDPWTGNRKADGYPVGEVVPSQSICADEELEQLPVYQEFLKQRGYHYGAGVTLARSEEKASALSVARPKERGPMREEELELWRSLVPHLVQAVRLRERILNLEAECARRPDPERRG